MQVSPHEFKAERTALLADHPYPDPWDYLSSFPSPAPQDEDLSLTFHEWLAKRSLTKPKITKSSHAANNTPLFFIWIGSTLPVKFQSKVASFREHHPHQPMIILVDPRFGKTTKPLVKSERAFLGWAKRTKMHVIPIDSIFGGVLYYNFVTNIQRLAPNYAAISDYVRLYFPLLLFRQFAHTPDELPGIFYCDCDLICRSTLPTRDRPLARDHNNDLIYIPSNFDGRVFLTNKIKLIQQRFQAEYYYRRTTQNIRRFLPFLSSYEMFMAWTICSTGPGLYDPSEQTTGFNQMVPGVFSGTWCSEHPKRWKQLGNKSEAYKKQFTYMLVLLIQEIITLRLEYFKALNSSDSTIASLERLREHYPVLFARIKYFPFSLVDNPEYVLEYLFEHSESYAEIIRHLHYSLVTIEGDQDAQLALIPLLVKKLKDKFGEEYLLEVSSDLMRTPADHRYHDDYALDDAWRQRVLIFLQNCFITTTHPHLRLQLLGYRDYFIITNDYSQVIPVWLNEKISTANNVFSFKGYALDVMGYAIFMNATKCITMLKALGSDNKGKYWERFDPHLLYLDADQLVNNPTEAQFIKYHKALLGRISHYNLVWPTIYLDYNHLLARFCNYFLDESLQMDQKYIDVLDTLLDCCGDFDAAVSHILNVSSHKSFQQVDYLYNWLLSRKANLCQITTFNAHPGNRQLDVDIVEYYQDCTTNNQYLVTPLLTALARLETFIEELDICEVDDEPSIQQHCDVIIRIARHERRHGAVSRYPEELRKCVTYLSNQIYRQSSYFSQYCVIELITAGYEEAALLLSNHAQYCR